MIKKYNLANLISYLLNGNSEIGFDTCILVIMIIIIIILIIIRSVNLFIIKTKHMDAYKIHLPLQNCCYSILVVARVISTEFHLVFTCHQGL